MSGRAIAGGGGTDQPAKESEVIDIETLSPSEDGPVRVDIPGVASNDMGARYAGDSLFLPFLAFCDMLRIRAAVSDDRMTLSGENISGTPFEITRKTGMITIGDKSIAFPGSSIRVVTGEIFIESSLLSATIGIISNYDPAFLKLTISADEKLPVVQLVRRNGHYGALVANAGDDASTGEASLERAIFSAPVISWQLTNSINAGMRQSYGGFFRLGQEFLFGILDVSAVGGYQTNVPGNPFTARINAASWRYQLPGSSLLSQVTLGTMDIGQKRVQGIDLTNVPLTPREGFGTYDLQGRTQPTWMVELYDGTRLVDVTPADGDGRYHFPIRTGYGTVDRTTKEIGPHGEIVMQNHRVQLDAAMLPAGEFDYEIGAGIDSLKTTSMMNGRGHLALGLFDRLTVGADAQYSARKITEWNRDSLDATPFASLWLGSATSFNVRYGIRSRSFGGSLSTILPNNATVRLGIDSLSIGKRIYSGTFAGTLPIGAISIGATGGYDKRSFGDRFTIEPQFSGYVEGINFMGSTRYTVIRDNAVAIDELAPSVTTTRSLTSDLRLMITPATGLLLSAAARYDHNLNKISSLDLSTYYRLTDELGINLSYSVPELDWKHGSVQAQLSIDLNAVRISTTAGYAGNAVTNNSFAQGSLIISPSGIRAFNSTSVGESAIIVLAFNDLNGNGIRDNGEETMTAPQTRISYANSQMISEDGTFHSLPANRSCAVDIDRWLYANDNLFPARSHFLIYTQPSGLEVIEIPFSQGYDVTGATQPAGVAGMIHGLRLQLISSTTGAAYDGEIFSDGTIFFAGVGAGQYRIVFDDEQLTARHLAVAIPSGAVTITATEHHLPTVEFRRVDEGRGK
ncbi:MAG: hypothetical protein ABIR47_06965, partial [Candidatus Kapaibacterium sp.]